MTPEAIETFPVALPLTVMLGLFVALSQAPAVRVRDVAVNPVAEIRLVAPDAFMVSAPRVLPAKSMVCVPLVPERTMGPVPVKVAPEATVTLPPKVQVPLPRLHAAPWKDRSPVTVWPLLSVAASRVPV